MAINSLASKIMKSAKGKGRAAPTLLTDSKYFERDQTATDCYALNILMSGDLNGGLKSGLTQLVGDSRTFKSKICIELIRAYLNAHEDAICVYINSEYGTSRNDWSGLDTDRVVEYGIETVFDLKVQMVNIIDNLEDDEKVIFFIDSVSQLASDKEAQDALDDHHVADMTRAKELNSVWRVITPKVVRRDIPVLFINSFYADTSSKYAENIIKGGKQGFLSSDQIWFVSRRQMKDDKTKELKGWEFVYTAMKSRSIREKSKIPIRVFYDGGIDKYSALFEIAQATGFIKSPSMGWYSRSIVKDDKKWRKKEIDGNQDEFWGPLVESEDFQLAIRNAYQVSDGSQETLTLYDPSTGEIVE